MENRNTITDSSNILGLLVFGSNLEMEWDGDKGNMHLAMSQAQGTLLPPSSRN